MFIKGLGRKMVNKRDKLTIIGTDAVIEGSLNVPNGIHIAGRVEGDILCEGRVVVAAGGEVSGELIGQDALVNGTVKGRVIVRNNLRVGATGLIRGDVFYGTLEIDRGARIQGQTKVLDELAAEEKPLSADDSLQLPGFNAVLAPPKAPPIPASDQHSVLFFPSITAEKSEELLFDEGDLSESSDSQSAPLAKLCPE